MKIALGILAGSLLNISAFAQGQVAFANTASTSFRVWTNTWNNTGSNLTSGANAYRFGLYAAQGAGQPVNSLTLVGLGTNIAAPIFNGFFSGGVPFNLPAPYAAGDTITFQIRAWSLAAGNGYAEALTAQAGDPLNVALGFSDIGTTVLTTAPAPPAPLFGTSPGLLSRGFGILPIPEPSTIALAMLGAVAVALFARRSKR